MDVATLLPNRRSEAWKYSDLRAALRDRPVPALSGRDHVIAELAGGSTRAAGDWLVDRLDGSGFETRSIEIDVVPGATFTRVVIQTGGEVCLSLASVRVGAGGRFRQFVLSEGGRLARLETIVEATGEGAQIELNGVYLVGAGRHADLTSRIVHAAPNGVTRQLVKGAALAGGRGVFQGKILVAEGAQKTDAVQNHHALLLAEGAEVFAKPELEIYADDVACAHGNTAGALNDAALFYLRSRGVPASRARALLVEAHLGEAIPEWIGADLAAEVSARIAAWLEAAP